MQRLKIETGFGNFDTTAKEAKELCKARGISVEYDFNGVTCIVDKRTDLKLLWRDYLNAHLMGWQEVGENMQPEYSEFVNLKIAEKKQENEIKQAEQARLQRVKDDADEQLVKEKVDAIPLRLKDRVIWREGLSKNTDPYGSCIYTYADYWGRLMQYEMNKGKSLPECAEKTSFELGFLGITGFMYGAAVAVLSTCWEYGEELRKWHNKDYGHTGSGVVNPAVLTINE